MPTFEERLDAITQTLELVAQMQLRTEEAHEQAHKQSKEVQARTEQIVNILAEDQAKLARIMQNLAVLVHDHEGRLKAIEGL